MLKERKLKELKEVIVFGAGYFGIMTVYFCEKSGVKVISCMDNNADRQGKFLFYRVPCKKPCFEKDITVIISLKKDELANQIYEQCRELGYTDIIFVDHDRLEYEYNNLPDKEFCELRYAMRFCGELPDLVNPITFNEKLQWLKLYDRRSEYTRYVDKYEVKKFISEKVGEEYLIPTLGVWNHFEEIDFNKLPNQFVLKSTHDSGSVVIVNDKKKLDIEKNRRFFERSLNNNFYYESREWPYKNVSPRIIAEKYLVDESGVELKDYKVFAFDGQAKLIQVDFDRFKSHKRNLYTTNWEYIDLMIEYPTDPNREIVRPNQLKKMLEIAEKISKGIPHVRVDFYSIGDKVYFGEMTFYHGSGLELFVPQKWNRIMGDWIKLPENRVTDISTEG